MSGAMSSQRTKAFLSFAEADRKWLERLRVQLRPLERLGLLDSWDNTRVLPGKNWRHELSTALQSARVAVLLISADFLASEFIMNEELPSLLDAARRGQVDILPILVRPCLFEMIEGLRDYKPIHAEPLSGLSSSDAEEVLRDVARAIQALLGTSPAAISPAKPARPGGAGGAKPRSAVLLTSLRVEFLAARKHLQNLREMVHPSGSVYEQGTFAGEAARWEVSLVEVGAGNSRAAMEAERAIQFLAPELVMFVGVAGGIKDVNLGDVVVANKVYGYESGKLAARFEPRPSVGETSYPLIQRALAEARRDSWLRRVSPAPASAPQVYVGPIAAGEKVVTSKSSELYEFLQAHYDDALAVEMEGRGFLEAAHANPQVQALVVRGISDLITRKKRPEGDSAELAARHASAFAFEILDRLGGA